MIKIILMLVFFISFFMSYNIFHVVNYINNKDSQSIKITRFNKIFISFFISVLNVIFFLQNGMNIQFYSYSSIMFFLMIIAYIDYYTKYVYEILSRTMIMNSLVIYIINIILHRADFTTFIVVLVMSIIIIIFAKFNYIGDGDVEVFIALFLVVNKYSFMPIVLFIFSMGISGVVSIILLLFKKASLNDRKPLCPSIALATVILFILI